MAKIVDLGNEIYTDSGFDDSHSIASIVAWMRFSANLGTLNNLLNTDYAVDSSSLEIVGSDGEIGIEEASIYKLLYFQRFYEKMTKNSLGAASVDVISEVSDSGGTIRFASRNDKSKIYNQLKKDTMEQLNKVLNSYRFSKYSPSDVRGDDTNVANTSLRIGLTSL